MGGFFKNHSKRLDAEFANNSVDSALVDGAQASCGHFQLNPTVLFGDVEAFGLQVWLLTDQLLALGVRDHVADKASLSSNFTNAAHDRLRVDWAQE